MKAVYSDVDKRIRERRRKSFDCVIEPGQTGWDGQGIMGVKITLNGNQWDVINLYREEAVILLNELTVALTNWPKEEGE